MRPHSRAHKRIMSTLRHESETVLTLVFSPVLKSDIRLAIIIIKKKCFSTSLPGPT